MKNYWTRCPLSFCTWSSGPCDSIQDSMNALEEHWTADHNGAPRVRYDPRVRPKRVR